MIVLSVLARKGGTGKSTAVRCLAVEALKTGRRVVIRRGPATDLSPMGAETCWGWYCGSPGGPPLSR